MIESEISECIGEEGIHPQTTSILRFQCVHTSCKEAFTSTEIPILPTTRRWQLPLEDGAGAGELQPLAGELPSDENHFHHGGSDKPEQPDAVGGSHRKVEQAVPKLLGPDRCSRRSGEENI